MRPVLAQHLSKGWLLIDRQARSATPLIDPSLVPGDVVRRSPSTGYAMASWDVTERCQLACLHCLMRDSGVHQDRDPMAIVGAIERTGAMWLHLTGGEPTIDPMFPDIYSAAWDAGMLIVLLTNGLTLERLLPLLAQRPPHRISTSLHGANAETYDRMTARVGSWGQFVRSMAAVHEAGLPVRTKIIVTRDNEHELPDMVSMASRFGEHIVFRGMVPTVGADPGPVSLECPHEHSVGMFRGCGAGTSMFHVRADGLACPCRTSRADPVPISELTLLRSRAPVLLALPPQCRECPRPCNICPPLYHAEKASGLDPCRRKTP